MNKTIKIKEYLNRKSCRALAFFAILAILQIHSAAGQEREAMHQAMSPKVFKEKLRGPILSAPTAFDSTFQIDYKGMAKVIAHALDYGCRVVTLTSGNSMYDRITYSEVKKLTKMMVETVGNRGVTIAATGKWPLDTILDYVRYAEKIGASAVQVDPPEGSDIDSNLKKTVRFYEDVAHHTKLAIVLHGYYSSKLLNELLKIKSIVALKEDVADLNYYVDRQIMFGNRIAVFAGGSDARYLFGYPYGSPAYFSVLYSYAPAIGLKFWQAIQQKNLKSAVNIAEKYDFPFMKKWTRSFWAAAIEYMGGSQRYIRPKTGETQKMKTLNEKELADMRNFMCGLGLKPQGSKYCGVVTEGNPLPLNMKRGGHAGGKVDGKVIVAGGSDWSLDKKTKSWLSSSAIFANGHWKVGPELPKAVAYGMYASDDHGVYLAGGTNGGDSDLSSVFQLKTLKDGRGWEELPSLPEATAYGAGAILNSKFYVACGSHDTTKTNLMWVLDVSEKGSNWHKCSPIPGVARILPAMVSSGGYLYLLGGLSDFAPLTPLKDAYRYDPKNGKWMRLKDLPFPGYAWAASSLDDTHLLITGRAYGKVDPGVWILDVVNMTIKEIGKDIIPAATAPLIHVNKDQWWLVGGEPDSNKNRTGKVSVISVK
ncbi:MAG: dihydrodipicolinate synthase family protein [Ginsengibacter sp.]